jgi:hypothetical protein
LLTLRGERMLDIAIEDSKLDVNLRFRIKALKSTEDILPDLLVEMEATVKEIESYIKK